MDIGEIAWEDLLSHIRENEREFGDELGELYGLCVKFNGFVRERY